MVQFVNFVVNFIVKVKFLTSFFSPFLLICLLCSSSSFTDIPISFPLLFSGILSFPSILSRLEFLFSEGFAFFFLLFGSSTSSISHSFGISVSRSLNSNLSSLVRSNFSFLSSLFSSHSFSHPFSRSCSFSSSHSFMVNDNAISFASIFSPL